MNTITENEFKKLTTQGELSGIYVLFGEEKFTLLLSARRVVSYGEKLPYADFNFIRLNSDCTINEFANAVESMPFFSDKKYVIMNDFTVDVLSPQDLKTFKSLTSELGEECAVVIYLPNTAKLSAKWSKIDNITFVEYKKKTGSELFNYLIAYAKKLGCTLSRDMAERIVRYNAGSLEQLVTELEKVCAYSGYGEIAREHIEAVVTKSGEEKAFALSKALLSKRYEEAHKILDALINQREEPIAILALLSSSYINLYRVKCMLESGLQPSELAEHFNYKGKSFILTNSANDCRNYSMQSIQKSISVLLEADIALKGGSGSSRESMKRVVLDETIAKLALVSQGDI